MNATSDRVVIPVAHAEAALERWAALASNEQVARLLTMELNDSADAFLRLPSALSVSLRRTTPRVWWCDSCPP